MLRQIIYLTFLGLTLSAHDSTRCARTLYLGSPVNTIHKALEGLDHILQVSNQNSVAHFIGGNNSTNNRTGEKYYDFLFRLDEESDHYANPTALIMRVSVNGANTFVDELLKLEGPNGQGDVNDKLNWFLDNKFALSDYKNKFYNTLAWKDCKLIKESYTYFFEMYGERFQTNLN